MERLKERISSGLAITGVATSFQTAIRARECGIPLTTLNEYPALDLAIDGADQVDPEFRLIKGRGAALTREKCVAAAARQFIVVVDESKLTPCLDAPVPLEVLPFAVRPVIARLEAMRGSPVIREGVKKDGPVITDNGNCVIDCEFGPIGNPEELEASLALIPGLFESGLFTAFTKKTKVIVGDEKKCRIL
jgi:ribose 5-phosphate isomerase A